MAIIQGFPGVQVTIEVRGWTTWEYDDQSETTEAGQNPRVTTKYIECSDDEPFKVCLEASKNYPWGYKDHALQFTVNIDGAWVGGVACTNEQVSNPSGEWRRKLSRRMMKDPADPSRYISQAFVFSKITKVSQATTKQHQSAVELANRIGTIEVEVYRAIFECEGANDDFTTEEVSSFVVTKQAANGKTITHGTKLLNTGPIATPRCTSWSKLREDGGPVAIFRFKYRSAEALRSKGIEPLPGPASVVPPVLFYAYRNDGEKPKINFDVRGPYNANVGPAQSKSLYRGSPRSKLETGNIVAVKEEKKHEDESSQDKVLLGPIDTTQRKSHTNRERQGWVKDSHTSSNGDVASFNFTSLAPKQLQERRGAQYGRIAEKIKAEIISRPRHHHGGVANRPDLPSLSVRNSLDSMRSLQVLPPQSDTPERIPNSTVLVSSDFGGRYSCSAPLGVKPYNYEVGADEGVNREYYVWEDTAEARKPHQPAYTPQHLRPLGNVPNIFSPAAAAATAAVVQPQRRLYPTPSKRKWSKTLQRNSKRLKRQEEEGNQVNVTPDLNQLAYQC